MQDLHMSQEVGTLTISLFVAGYCVGPILWGPLSEQVNRFQTLTWLMLTLISFSMVGDRYSSSRFLYTRSACLKIVSFLDCHPLQGFQVGCALAKNSASLLVFRFLSGTFAAAPLTNSG